mgnify:CR=1 FL=1
MVRAQADHVAGVSLRYLNPLEALEVEDGGDFGSALAPVTVDADAGVAHLDFAAVNLAEGDAPQVIGVIQVGGQQPESLAWLPRALAGVAVMFVLNLSVSFLLALLLLTVALLAGVLGYLRLARLLAPPRRPA